MTIFSVFHSYIKLSNSGLKLTHPSLSLTQQLYENCILHVFIINIITIYLNIIIIINHHQHITILIAIII
jgi:hypothetical protein